MLAPSHRWLIPLGITWLSAVGVGFWMLASYENTPGIAAVAPERWPADSRIDPLAHRASLIMLAHPHCPCTRASIGELAVLMAHAQGLVSAYVLFVAPKGFADDWHLTDLWDSAAAIPGVTVLQDDDGQEALRFHAATSGQTLLYDAEGRLVFSGGITDARGHSGDNTAAPPFCHCSPLVKRIKPRPPSSGARCVAESRCALREISNVDNESPRSRRRTV